MSVAEMSKIEELEDYTELDGLVDPAFLPNPEVSRCFVYRGEDGKVEGYVFIQPIVVIEPIWVAEKHRKRGVAPRLFGEAVEALKRDGTSRGFYCRAERPEIESYLKRVGMKEAGKAFALEFGG
jgi:GNAT superfamily N-acetyltransferase